MNPTKKLNFDALPKFLHGRNLRKEAPYAWRFVREGMLEQGCQCHICGATPTSEADRRNFHAHEVWSYDLKQHLLILEDVELICHLCHQCDHMGLLQLKLSRGEITEEEYWDVFHHYAKVNEISFMQAKMDYVESVTNYRKNPLNYDTELAQAPWQYQLKANFPAKERMENALRKKNLLFEKE